MAIAGRAAAASPREAVVWVTVQLAVERDPQQTVGFMIQVHTLFTFSGERGLKKFQLLNTRDLRRLTLARSSPTMCHILKGRGGGIIATQVVPNTSGARSMKRSTCNGQGDQRGTKLSHCSSISLNFICLIHIDVEQVNTVHPKTNQTCQAETNNTSGLSGGKQLPAGKKQKRFAGSYGWSTGVATSSGNVFPHPSRRSVSC